jgi:solute carrier family 35 protein E1
MTTTDRRWSSSSSSPRVSKFPDYEPQLSPRPREHETIFEEDAEPRLNGVPPLAAGYGKTNGSAHTDRWAAWRDGSQGRLNGHAVGGGGGRRGHARQKSLSDAIRTINSRRGSVSANAQEIADALKAPVSYTLIVRLTVDCTLSI